jgi:hypothetical protein
MLSYINDSHLERVDRWHLKFKHLKQKLGSQLVVRERKNKIEVQRGVLLAKCAQMIAELT